MRKVALGLVAFAYKPVFGLVFFASYALYFYREMPGSGEDASEDGLAPLTFQPHRASPATWAVLAQTAATLVLIFGAWQIFVQQLEWAGPALCLRAVVVALLLSPIATELPEILNAVIWVRQGKVQLALANISGAMMIQATVPSGIALLATDWRFDTAPALAGFAYPGLGRLSPLADLHPPADPAPAACCRDLLRRLRSRAGRHSLTAGVARPGRRQADGTSAAGLAIENVPIAALALSRPAATCANTDEPAPAGPIGTFSLAAPGSSRVEAC